MIEDAVGRLTAQLPRWQVPGVQLAVVASGAMVYAGGVGVRGIEDPALVTGSTLFHHGSCTKAYTGLLASVLAEEGLLDLDAPVRRLVPELSLPDPFIAERVTTRDLLSHRSGLGRHDMTWILNPSWSRTELIRRLEHLPLDGDLRARFAYTNFGYALAGEVIGRATDSSWEAQLRIRILEPLAMHRTWTSVGRTCTDDDHARAHLRIGHKAMPTSYRRLDGIAPAGQLMTSAEDAARWLLLQAGGAGDGLPSNAVAETHRLQIPIPPEAVPYPEMQLSGYALGWLVGTYRGHPFAWHNGGVDGFLTQCLILPSEGLGVLASANLHMSDLPLAAVLDIVDGLLGVESNESWFERLHPDEPDKPPKTAPRPASPSQPLAAFDGTYANPGYGDIKVTAVSDGLDVRFGECDLTSQHRHFDTWDLQYADLDVDMALTFVTDSRGDVVEAAVEVEPGTKPLHFDRVG